MAKRTIYINPGDMIELRIINDPELERNNTEWKYQVRPESILLQFKGYKHISCADPAVRFDDENFISQAELLKVLKGD